MPTSRAHDQPTRPQADFGSGTWRAARPGRLVTLAQPGALAQQCRMDPIGRGVHPGSPGEDTPAAPCRELRALRRVRRGTHRSGKGPSDCGRGAGGVRTVAQPGSWGASVAIFEASAVRGRIRAIVTRFDLRQNPFGRDGYGFPPICALNGRMRTRPLDSADSTEASGVTCLTPPG